MPMYDEQKSAQRAYDVYRDATHGESSLPWGKLTDAQRAGWIKAVASAVAEFNKFVIASAVD